MPFDHEDDKKEFLELFAVTSVVRRIKYIGPSAFLDLPPGKRLHPRLREEARTQILACKDPIDLSAFHEFVDDADVVAHVVGLDASQLRHASVRLQAELVDAMPSPPLELARVPVRACAEPTVKRRRVL
jgi:hypothetical protein